MVTPPNHAASALSPEARLLFRTAASRPGEPELERLLLGPVDWSELVLLAQWEKALPILWTVLGHREDLEIPESVRTHLRQTAMVTLFQQRLLRERLEESVAALSAQGIPTVLLKGAALALTVYPGFHARPMGDLDLLVLPEHAEAARRALLEVKWRDDAETWPPTAYHDHHHLPPLKDPRDGNVRLEIHTDLLVPGHPFALTPELIMAHSRPCPEAGAGARVPHPVHHLLYVCTHFAWSHLMQKGAWIAFRDVDALAARGGISWDEVIMEARALGVTGPTFWTLHLAAALAGARTGGDAVLRALRPDISSPVLSRLERHLALHLVPGEKRSCPSIGLARFLWSLAMEVPEGHDVAVQPWVHARGFLPRDSASTDENGSSDGGRPSWEVGRWTNYLAGLLTPAASG